MQKLSKFIKKNILVFAIGGFAGDTLYLKDYQLINSVYGNLIANKVNATTTPALYWLASLDIVKMEK